uniref:Zinc finger protein 865 n=1 Tax=Stomoxys calcitrans TaxID=35570 RepID=A0A1I8PPL1_STOCA
MINTMLEHVSIKIEAEEQQAVANISDNNNHELHIKQEPGLNYIQAETNGQAENLLVKQEISDAEQNAELQVLRVESPPKRPRRSTRNAVEVQKLKPTANSLKTAKKETQGSKDTDEGSESYSLKTTRVVGKKRFTCEYCPRTFTKRHRLTEHLNAHRNPDEKPFTCDECGKQFRLHIRMKEHKLRHSKTQKYVCEICNLGCCTKPDYKLHMRHHTNDRRFQCTMCPKAFVRSSDLKTHMRVHTGEKPYVCEVCKKCFRANQNLIVHKKLHLGEASKIFKCEYCEKKFLRNSDRKIHMRSHTGEKPFKCEMCDRCYSSNVNVKAHMQRDHLGEEPRIRKKPGPKPKDWKEEVAKQQKLIEELQNQLKLKMKNEEEILPDQQQQLQQPHHFQPQQQHVVVTKIEKLDAEEKPIIQKISVTVSMTLENVTPSTSKVETTNVQETQSDNRRSRNIKGERKSTS